MSKIGASKIRSLAESYKNECIVTDGSILKCEACDSMLKVDSKHQKPLIDQHIRTQRHRDCVKIRHSKSSSSSSQSFLSNSFAKAAENNNAAKKFESDLTKALIQSNIPLFKVNCAPFRKFLEEYTKKKIPDESSLRKSYVNPVYLETIDKIRTIIGDSDISFIVDETTDATQRFVFNVLVMPLKGAFVKPMLIKMYDLEETNNSTVMQSINDACMFLWPNGVKYDKVVLIVSDQAAYMKLAISNLKALYPKLHHVTCLAHSLHRVCEAVRDEYDAANNFLSCFRKLLLKAPARVQLYKEVTELPLPPDTIVTRWGSWITSATFLCENFNKIKTFVQQLPNDGKATNDCKRLVDDDVVKDELFNSATYKFLTVAIEKLEKSGLKKEEQWQIYDEVKALLYGFAREKLDSSLNNNPDVVKFVKEKDPEFRLTTMYAPLVSVDVERSFSQYKMLLSDRRRNFTFQNIEMISVVNYNSFLFE